MLKFKTTYKIKEIIRSRRRTLSLIVNPDASLTIKAPILTPLVFINKFIENNSGWINKKTTEAAEKPKAIKYRYLDGEKFPYLGKKYVLKIGHYNSINIDDLCLCFPVYKLSKIKSALTEWYKKQALEVIKTRVKYYSGRMNLKYSSIKISEAETRWGSCSHDNKLRFNWKLIMTPQEIIDYVVVHELSHIIHKNHSQRFWIEVRNYIPDCKRRIKWLKIYGHSMTI